MNRFFSILIVMALIACTNEDEQIVLKTQSNSDQNVSAIRSFDEALQIAQNSIGLLDGQAATRAAKPRTIDMKADKVVKAVGTRAAALTNDTLMYVFNFEDNQGFAVIAAPRSVDPLIAVTEEGDYDPQNPPQIDGFNFYMNMAQDWVTASLGKGDDVIRPITKEEYGYALEKRGPFVTVRWGQEYPEGEYCSNGLSGCTNTALGQIMSYYEYPTSINLTYPNADISTQTLNWTEMKAHQTGHSISSCTEYQNAHQAIGRMMRQLGYMNSSTYHFNPLTTLTYYSDVESTIANLGFHHQSWADYDSLYAYNHLKVNHPMMIRGSDGSGGHAWVLDGYRDTQHITYYYENTPTNPGEWVLYATDIRHKLLFHFNWGWYGLCNGYYKSEVFNTANGWMYDDFENPNVEYNFQYTVKLLPIYRNQ